ncbi:MAG: acetyl-CoA carboxylase carboxyltransferase subunit beta [Hyphomonadaceae bacterium]|nr:acetyl-CoA carboxylase carboxyltransferase subunit beta [Hyphomonadaceae bacterium]
MNWLSNFARPGVKKEKKVEVVEDKRETPDNLWIKCPVSGELVFRSDLEAAHWVTPAGFHMRIGAEPRFKQLFDDQRWTLLPAPKVPLDPIKFKDDKKYVDRLKAAKAKSPKAEDCMTAAAGEIGARPAVVLVQDFDFMGGSLGMAAGEAFISAAHAAVERDAALVCFTASGGARMQEGILSLMQMARTTSAVQELNDAGLPYIVVLTDPTTGGVTASYAMLGDVHIAEPGALIGFAGPRVIEQTIRQKLPEGFQRAEYLLSKGMVDMVLDRRQIRDTLAVLLNILMSKRAAIARPLPKPVAQEAFAPEVEAPRLPAAAARAKPQPKPRAKAAE